MAFWTKIYQLKATGLVDVSSSFASYYQSRLSELQQRVTNETDPSCDMMEIVRIQRILGTAPAAEFALAQQWRTSPDPDMRSKAVDLFGDIGDRLSVLELRNISLGDSNNLVRSKATASLMRLSSN